MNCGAVAVVGNFVGLAGSKMEGTGDLFVEKNVAHRILNEGIKADGEFADVTSASVCIENFVQAFCVVGCGVDHFAVVELEPDIVETGSGVERRRIEMNDTIDRSFYRAGEDLAVGNI